MKIRILVIIALIMAAAGTDAAAQIAPRFKPAVQPTEPVPVKPISVVDTVMPPPPEIEVPVIEVPVAVPVAEIEITDTCAMPTDTLWVPILRDHHTLNDFYFRPLIFDTFELLDPLALISEPVLPGGVTNWLDDRNFSEQLLKHAQQRHLVDHPDMVRYNIMTMPEPPKTYRATVDHRQAKIVISEAPRQQIAAGERVRFGRRNWLHSFTGSVQFSQAYLSPNWYQGGNNNLNAIISAVMNVKLNPAFYPNLLFETTASYKLGLNSAPEDSLRSYSISEDLLQINTKAGYKAGGEWYYSLTGQFKTQLLNNYKKNTRTLAAALFSPGELNIGLGMTYSHTTANKRLSINTSISPLSYNLKTCLHPDMDVTAYGIKLGHKTVSEVGSSGEFKIKWLVTGNITYTSRFFLFTDYHYIQGDWENTVSMAINRFLSTQIYVHLRYDSSTTPLPDSRWDDWQLKEILSFGFNYKFTSY